MNRCCGQSRLWLAVAAICLSLLLGEALVRLAALFLPGVDYLASASFKGRPAYFGSLEEFAASQKDLIPRRNWANYAVNNMGFNDREFQAAKPPGLFRIMALGDSFCYGMVPYPANVQTLVEESLNRDCPRKMEIMNMGLPGAHTWEYETLFRLACPVFQPDLVVVHFYMGNDGPDLVRHLNGLPMTGRPLWSSYLFSFARNAFKYLTAVEKVPLPSDQNPPSAQAPPQISGGGKINPALPDLNDDSPSFREPRFTVQAFFKQLQDELVRFHDPGPEHTRQDWGPILANLEGIRKEAKERGMETALVLYPSVLQVYPDLMAKTAALAESRGSIPGFAPGRVDPRVPNLVLGEYARQNRLPFLDLTPVFAEAAGTSLQPLYLNRDTHWNFKGNRLAARHEAAFIEDIVCGTGKENRLRGAGSVD